MPDSAWQRLGEALARRRVEISPRYRNLSLFARERGLNERLVADIEHGRRAGYRAATRHALEIAYELDPGRIGRFVAGEVAGLVPVTGEPGDAALAYVASLPGMSSRDRAALEHVAASPGLDTETRLLLVDLTRAMIARQGARERPA